MKPDEIKAVERQLKEVINLIDKMDVDARCEAVEVKEAAEKALQMMPRYKKIDELVESVRKLLLEANHYEYHFETHAQCMRDERGFMVGHASLGKTITIEVR